MQLTFDLYSGRQNPTWRLPSPVSRKVFDLIADHGLLRWTTSAVFPGWLGYRGLEIVLPAELARRYSAPRLLNLPADAFDHLALLRDLLLVASLAGLMGFIDLQKLVRLIIDLFQRSGPPAAPKVGAGQMGPCAFEMLPYDPAPWNDPVYKPTNNCYAYACNRRDKYPSKPQPGIASGKIFESLTGPDVAAAAKRDGAHEVNDCFPDNEAPRLLVALVIWPEQDYHWYRKHPDFWGHKPGSTDARNVDSSGNVITDPKTCNRGPYTEFYGYMLIPKSQRIAA